jgi:hypothetical protein
VIPMDTVSLRCWACLHCRAAVAVITRPNGARVPVCAQHRAEANARHEDIVIAPTGGKRGALEIRP